MDKIIATLCREHGTLVHFKKNMILFQSDYKMETPYIYYLIDGICALTGNSYYGKEHVLLYFMSGSLIGINQFLDGFGSNLFSYSTPTGVTKTECTLYRIPVSVVLDLLETNLEFNKYIVNTLSKYYHLTLAHLKQIQEDNAATVICRFLLSMSEKKEEGFVVARFFTYEEISKYLGVHIVTAGKIISRLQQLGYIKRISSGILIQDETALKELISNCESFRY